MPTGLTVARAGFDITLGVILADTLLKTTDAKVTFQTLFGTCWSSQTGRTLTLASDGITRLTVDAIAVQRAVNAISAHFTGALTVSPRITWIDVI